MPEPTFIRRVAPAVLLTLLAPIIAEFLLGDFSIKSLPVAIALLPLYGCGALLIREVARRTDRGWPTIVLLASAYSLIEEGFLTQSLFNPNYVGQRLLDYGYIPRLGTSLNWSVLVLSIHVVWSIATPILIAEGIAAGRRTAPWLRIPGLVTTGVLFLLGCASTTAFSLRSSPFVASTTQFVVVGLLALGSIACAFLVGSGDGRVDFAPARAPHPFLVFTVCLVAATIFMLAEGYLRGRGQPPAVSVAVRVACEMIGGGLVIWWSRASDWGSRHYLAIASATTLTYALFGFAAFLQGHTNLGVPTDTIDLAGQVALSAAVFLLIGWAATRNRLPDLKAYS
jgi:hypothetical protein